MNRAITLMLILLGNFAVAVLVHGLAPQVSIAVRISAQILLFAIFYGIALGLLGFSVRKES